MSFSRGHYAMESETVTRVTETYDTSIGRSSADPVVQYEESALSEIPKTLRDGQRNSIFVENTRDATPRMHEVFQITRPFIVKSTGTVTTENCKPVPEKTCDNSMTTRCKQLEFNKNVNLVPRNVLAVPGSGKLSGYRNKQYLIPCNSHNAILLPRPQSSVANAGISEAHIQRIPVLNNTHFQLPKNSPINTESSLHYLQRFVNNTVTDYGIRQSNTAGHSDGAVNKRPRLTTDASEAVHPGNSFCFDRNNNSRVRNTKEDGSKTQSSVNMAEDKQMCEDNSQNINKLNNDLKDNANRELKGSSDQEMKCNPLQQNFLNKDKTSEILNISVQNESCPKMPEITNFHNEKPGPDTVVVNDFITNYPSTSQSFAKELPQQGDTFKDYVSVDLTVSKESPNSSSVDNILSSTSEKTESDCITNATQNIGDYAEEREFPGCYNLANKTNREAVVDHTVTTPSSKRRKRPHRANKNDKNDVPGDDDKTKGKKGYLIKNQYTHKKQKEKESSVKQIQSKQPFPQNSKAYQYIESRYMVHDSTGATSVEKVFEEKCDIINKVESEKLSKVKNHHLLHLSDKEREYLRNKCYLENDLTVDVRRRFEAQPEGSKNEIVNGALTCNTAGNETVDKDAIRKQTTPLSVTTSSEPSLERNGDLTRVCSGASTSCVVGMKGEVTKDNEERQKRNEKEQQINEKSAVQYQFNISLKQPVVRLQRLDCIPHEKQEPVIKTYENQHSTSTKQQTTNYPSTSKKVYYVVNSNDIARFKKPAGCMNSADDVKNKMSEPPTITPTGIVNTTGTINGTVATPFSQASTNITQSFTGLTQKTYTTPNLNVALSDTHLQHQQTILKHNRNSDALKLATTTAVPLKTYSNKLTVKKLLETKRNDRKHNSEGSRQLDEKSKHTICFPVQLYGRAIYGSPLTTKVATSQLEETSAHPEISANGLPSNTSTVVLSNSNGNTITNSISRTVNQAINRGGIQTQTSRNLHIVGPSHSVLIPISSNQRALIASRALASLPVMSRKPGMVMPPEINASAGSNNLPLQSESEKRNPVYIKIGGQTMVVKRCEDKTSTNRKTLPAPKAKRTIADDYKRKRRRSREMFKQRGHHKSLRSNLRKLLKGSHNSVHELVNSLDLVPVDILKQFTSTKVKEESVEREFEKQKEIDSLLNANDIQEAKEVPSENDDNQNRQIQQKSKCSNNLANMANVVQISKNENGSVSYSIQQVKIRYRKRRSGKRKSSSRHLGFSGRLQFSADGEIEKIYVESLRQGLYLLHNTNWDKAKLENEKKLNTSLVLYPPHIATLPCGSLSIAVGDMYSEKQKKQYTFETDSKDIDSVLEKFLWPFAMKNIDDFIDKRYSSITDQNMSPRCNSPMFYSEEMRDAFDFFENSPSPFDLSSKDLPVSRRSETSFAKFDIQSTRFSERAMALKIKQNELFESCRRLKTDQTVKEGYKKKREKVVRSDASRTENTKNSFDGGVRILGCVHSVFSGLEQHCCETSTSEDANDKSENIFDVAID